MMNVNDDKISEIKCLLHNAYIYIYLRMLCNWYYVVRLLLMTDGGYLNNSTE